MTLTDIINLITNIMKENTTIHHKNIALVKSSFTNKNAIPARNKSKTTPNQRTTFKTFVKIRPCLNVATIFSIMHPLLQTLT